MPSRVLSSFRSEGGVRRSLVAFAALSSLLLLGQPVRAQDDDLVYDVLFDVRIVPTERTARVKIKLDNKNHLLKVLDFRVDPQRHFDFKGDGEIDVGEGRVKWTPPPSGGVLRYTFSIDHLRDDRSYDARCTKTWALFRGDDLVPPARSVFENGARSHSRLRLRLPEGWSRAVPYPLISGGFYRVSHPRRGFDRPTGWFVLGQLGAVREEVRGVKVAIAGPVQHGMRRQDILALLRWTFPTLERTMGTLPSRLLIVGAGDPMWRGGLSGPGSVYVHARRPLIAEDGTSPVLHEIMHAMLSISAGSGGDWIVEGLAEYYSLELLRRSGTLSHDRVEKVYRRLAERGRSARALESDRSSGAVTARAVTVLRALDQEIRDGTDGKRSLDDVARDVMRKQQKVTTKSLKNLAQQTSGLDLDAFFDRAVAPR